VPLLPSSIKRDEADTEKQGVDSRHKARRVERNDQLFVGRMMLVYRITDAGGIEYAWTLYVWFGPEQKNSTR